MSRSVECVISYLTLEYPFNLFYAGTLVHTAKVLSADF